MSHLFAFPSVCSTYSLNTACFSPVFIYSAILYYVKWCLLIHACTPLIHSLCTLWIWPKFIASLVCLLSFFKILLILTPHIRDLTCLCSCDEKMEIHIFSEAEQNLYLHKRSSKTSSGSNEKISAIYWWWNEDVCWNKSLYFSHALFTAKTGFHFSKWKPFLLFFLRNSCLNRNHNDKSVCYVSITWL